MPLATAEGPVELHFSFSDAPLWDVAEWNTSVVVGRDVDPVSDAWAELRRSGAEYLLFSRWTGDLRIRPGEVIGRPRSPHLRIPLEMEFLEVALAVVLHPRGVPVLHGATISIDGGAVGLLATSGSGKSSLAIALLMQGCALLSDDVFAVHGSEHLIWPGHFGMRIHADTAAALLPVDSYRPLFPGYEQGKYVTNVRRWGRVSETPLPLRALYLVDAQAGMPDARITSLRGFAALRALVDAELGRFGDQAARFSRLSELARDVPVRRLSFPRDYTALPYVADLLIRDAQTLSTPSVPVRVGHHG
jgi:hypothetical protein